MIASSVFSFVVCLFFCYHRTHTHIRHIITRDALTVSIVSKSYIFLHVYFLLFVVLYFIFDCYCLFLQLNTEFYLNLFSCFLLLLKIN